LHGADARKLTLVLRKRSGDPIEICDSAGSSFAATVELDGAAVAARLGRRALAAPARLEIVLAQGVPKGQKMDFVVEKATELGVSRIVPVETERSVPEGGRAGKVERWRRLARAAAAQSGRTEVPAVDDALPWAQLEGAVRAAGVALVPWELAETIPLRESLPALLNGVSSVLVAIGPEGGLTHDEVAQARAWGARPISLGKRILRTETAGLVACSAILYAAGEL
jgi:16S rRNA (uracil1498-N3)-methyltransferase